jgi:hypothetical protein
LICIKAAAERATFSFLFGSQWRQMRVPPDRLAPGGSLMGSGVQSGSDSIIDVIDAFAGCKSSTAASPTETIQATYPREGSG